MAPCYIENPRNDEGNDVAQGYDDNYENYYYCGLKREYVHIQYTDGRCGPGDGNNCASCKRFTRAMGFECFSDDEDTDAEYSDDEPQISFTEGRNPHVEITHRGERLPYEAYIPSHTQQISSEEKYPFLFEDTTYFDMSKANSWHATEPGGMFDVISVETKDLGDVDVDAFARACDIMNNDVRGDRADAVLKLVKDMCRPYFRTDQNQDGLRGLLPVPITTLYSPKCLAVNTHDWMRHKYMHIAFVVKHVVKLLNIEFDTFMCDELTMSKTPAFNRLFELLQDQDVLPRSERDFHVQEVR